MKDLYEMSVIFAGAVFVYLLMLSPYVLLQTTTPGTMSLLNAPGLVFPLVSVILISFFYTLVGLVLLRER